MSGNVRFMSSKKPAINGGGLFRDGVMSGKCPAMSGLVVYAGNIFDLAVRAANDSWEIIVGVIAVIFE